MFVTTRPMDAPSSKNKEGPSDAVIIAVVIGGLVAAVIIFVGGYYLWKSRYVKEGERCIQNIFCGNKLFGLQGSIGKIIKNL